MTEVACRSPDLRWFRLNMAATALLTYMVCLAAEAEGKRPQTERGGLGTQYQLCLLERGGVCWMSSQHTFQEPRQKKKKKPSTQKQSGREEPRDGRSLITLRFGGRRQTRTERAPDERNQNRTQPWTGCSRWTTGRTGLMPRHRNKSRNHHFRLVVLFING